MVLGTLPSVFQRAGVFEVGPKPPPLIGIRLGEQASDGRGSSRLGDAQQAKGDVPAARATWRQALTILSGLPNADIQPVKARLAQYA